MTTPMRAIEEALDAASAALMARYGGPLGVVNKGEIDLVTIADQESEAIIKRILGGHFPGHSILAEESGGDRSAAAGEHRWLVDPLDGTTNFAHGFPMFSVSIAFQRGGEIVAAGVENPFYKERFLAEKGSGATLGGRPLRVSATTELASSLAITGFPYDRRQRLAHYLAVCGVFLQRTQGILRIGSAALDLCSVACGRADLYWEENLQPWDTAAGSLVVTEAGGSVTDFSGGMFDPFGKQILATNGHVHVESLAAIASSPA